MRNKFLAYLDLLESELNYELINIVKSGFNTIYEEVFTPVPHARITDWGGVSEVKEPLASDWNVKQNQNNEYFKQTLTDKKLSVTNKAYIGKREGTYPQPTRTHTNTSGDKHLSGNWGTSQGNSEYVGSSGGYSLGGPTDAG